jgi:hypothetical protein
MKQHKVTLNNAKSCFIGYGLMLAILLTGGCSSFHQAWQEAGKTPPPADRIAGRWEGTWLSHVNGHSGKLRAILAETEPGTYQARFHATYQHILTFEYTVTLHAEHNNNESTFMGQADLGAMAGGVYQYNGTATPTEFSCRYKAKSDHGLFEMKRPE